MWVQDATGRTPLHWAAEIGNVPLVQALVAAAPGTATVRPPFSWGRTPLHEALVHGHFAAARCLLVGSTAELLAECGPAALPLYADLAASRPLTALQWARVPAPCPALAVALPDVLARSPAEARLLVEHLAPGQRQRLRNFALCLVRTQKRARVALPAELMALLLAEAGSQLA